MRDVRQLWAGLINCITSSLKLLPSKVGAEMCNHTLETHQKSYDTRLFDEESQIFRKYHAMLGEDQCMNSNQAIHFKQVSDGTMLESLRMLFGKDANFNSPEQKQMVQYCCQHSSNHKFIIIGCGGGKTLSLLIPVISSIITHRDIGCRIFIVPYSFLRHSLQSLFSRKLTNLFGSLVTVESYSKSEINESQLPSSLQQRMPNILILTPDSAANLIEYHSGALQRLNHDNSLKGVYIDEAQTILSEFSFRQSMEKLRRFTELECPITFLSGSFPRSVIPSLLNYFNISDGGEKSVDLVQSDDLLGDGFDFDVVRVSNIILHAAEIIKTKLDLGIGKVHVICKSRLNCISLGKKLEYLGINVAVTYSGSEGQKTIAKKWYNGEYDVLCSTINALVGNECPSAKFIIALEQIFSIANIFQAIGRLRQQQRGPNSSFTQIITDQNVCTNESDRTIQCILDSKVIQPADSSDCKQWFHLSAYVNLLESDGCYLQKLHAFNEYSLPEDCRRCTWCKN
jgi:superfamily II DNA helicase RecQ